MQVLVDYRSALRERSGVGEYAFELLRALLSRSGTDRNSRLELSVFSSSWRDRLQLPAELSGVVPIDRRVPGRVLNFAWHRLEWPPVEILAGRSFDIAHSLHPLLLPARAAARIVTIHDLYFLAHPERTRAEIRRDYPALARNHALRADAVIVVSRFTGREVERRFEVPPDRIAVCSPGAPPWAPREVAPEDGYILFMGTLEPRKNVGGLIDAYEQLIRRRRDIPRLVLAGKALAGSTPWLERIGRPPLSGHVEHVGYVQPPERRTLYEGARLLVQPSFEEGFGIPVLEAMTLGVPAIAANRGALPEVLGDAGPLVDPDEPTTIAAAIERLIDDDAFAAACASKGVARSKHFSWDATAGRVYDTYRRAIERRCGSA